MLHTDTVGIDSGKDFDRFSFTFICRISTRSEMTEDIQSKIEQKQTGFNAMPGTQKSFPLSLPVGAFLVLNLSTCQTIVCQNRQLLKLNGTFCGKMLAAKFQHHQLY